MKRLTRFGILVLLVVAGLCLAACQPVRPLSAVKAQRSVRGEILLPGVKQWDGVAVSMDVDVTETDPATHAATGAVHWRVFQPNPPAGDAYWKDVESDARNVFFGVDVPGGDPNTAVVVTQITDKAGWGQGQPGDYGYFWFRDGGATEPDQWGMRYYSLDPWYEFYPADKSPAAAGYFTVKEMQGDDPVLPLNLENGNITVTQ